MVQYDERRDVVSAICLCNYPNVPSVPPCDWLSWLKTIYGYIQFSAVFCHRLSCNKRKPHDCYTLSVFCVRILFSTNVEPASTSLRRQFELKHRFTGNATYLSEKDHRRYGEKYDVCALAGVGRALFRGSLPQGPPGRSLRHHHLLPARDPRGTSSGYARWPFSYRSTSVRRSLLNRPVTRSGSSLVGVPYNFPAHVFEREMTRVLAKGPARDTGDVPQFLYLSARREKLNIRRVVWELSINRNDQKATIYRLSIR